MISRVAMATISDLVKLDFVALGKSNWWMDASGGVEHTDFRGLCPYIYARGGEYHVTLRFMSPFIVL